MESATRSARNILTGLHEVMASKNHAQGKLNHVVNIIGEALSSEVCSIYLLRDGALELFATRGLNQAAVHVTRLGLGEGLVGTIAENVETLNLDEAAAHPNFRYVPETGEERFHSFAGVPIVRSESAVGVRLFPSDYRSLVTIASGRSRRFRPYVGRTPLRLFRRLFLLRALSTSRILSAEPRSRTLPHAHPAYTPPTTLLPNPPPRETALASFFPTGSYFIT